MNLVDKIKETAHKKGMTLADVTEKANLGPKTISNWRNRKPRTDTLQKVADVLGVSVDYLLGNTDDMYSTATKNNDELQPEDIVVLNKIRTAGLNDEQLQKLDDYIEFLKYDYIREMQDDK
ncbi:helix-turn-helix domain-containing protein [Weissella viridescens]|uniref:helix-turn-helix domain-containing protein n=1 Tax=Weissella viridescens TaxID=1629 RepID=UPI0035271A1D